MSSGEEYSGLIQERLRIYPDFAQRQRQASREIYEILRPQIQAGIITRIIDLGCGTGEILIQLQAELERACRSARDTKISLLGIDVSEVSIDEANRQLPHAVRGDVELEFVRCAVDTTLFAEIDRRRDRTISSAAYYARTAVICTGHTLYHLPYLKELLSSLGSEPACRPKLWIIDLYHSWGRMLQKIEEKEYLEPRSIAVNADGKKVVNVLFSRKSPTHSDMLERGLYEMTIGEADDACREVISTVQLAWSESDLIQQFFQARYLLAGRTMGQSGYGEMIRLVFAVPDLSFSLPALFMESKIDPTPIQKQRAGDSEISPPLEMLKNWLADSQLIESRGDSSDNVIGRNFDFVMIEVAPWFKAWEGRRALSQEVLIVGRDDEFTNEELAAVLDKYQLAVRGLQQLNIGPFIHPRFAGYDGDSSFGEVCMSVLQGPISGSELQNEREQLLYGEWLVHLENIQLPTSESSSERQPVTMHDRKINALYQRSSLQDLVVKGLPDYVRRLASDYGQEPNAQVTDFSAAELLRDLELVHSLLHECLRRSFGLDSLSRKSNVNSVLLGIPLRSGYSRHEPGAGGLPDDYRGGIWIFAGKRGAIAPGEMSLLIDFARLASISERASIDAQAADALSASLQRDYYGTLAHEIKKVIDGIKPSSPERLQRVREYFNLLSLPRRDFERHSEKVILAWLQGCPYLFCRGATIQELVQNQFKVALEIQKLAWEADKSFRASYDAINPAFSWLSKRDRPMQDDFCCRDASSSERPKQLMQLYFFCAALVATFRNVLQQQSPERRDILVSVENDAVEIRNYVANGDHEDQASVEFKFGTEAVILGYVQQYRPDKESAVRFELDMASLLGQGDKERSEVWLTIVPLPAGATVDENISH